MTAAEIVDGWRSGGLSGAAPQSCATGILSTGILSRKYEILQHSQCLPSLSSTFLSPAGLPSASPLTPPSFLTAPLRPAALRPAAFAPSGPPLPLSPRRPPLRPAAPRSQPPRRLGQGDVVVHPPHESTPPLSSPITAAAPPAVRPRAPPARPAAGLDGGPDDGGPGAPTPSRRPPAAPRGPPVPCRSQARRSLPARPARARTANKRAVRVGPSWTGTRR